MKTKEQLEEIFINNDFNLAIKWLKKGEISTSEFDRLSFDYSRYLVCTEGKAKEFHYKHFYIMFNNCLDFNNKIRNLKNGEHND